AAHERGVDERRYASERHTGERRVGIGERLGVHAVAAPRIHEASWRDRAPSVGRRRGPVAARRQRIARATVLVWGHGATRGHGRDVGPAAGVKNRQKTDETEPIAHTGRSITTRARGTDRKSERFQRRAGSTCCMLAQARCCLRGYNCCYRSATTSRNLLLVPSATVSVGRARSGSMVRS